MDKKLKNAADKIRMPEDMKQRIISAAELAEKNHVNTDNDGYIDVVSSAERVDPRRNIIRTISAIAACAVLVGGIGTTGFLLHRQNSTQMSGSEVSGTECRSCPFGDFSEFDYRFDAGDGKFGEYSAETYAKLSDFLNKFNWGEELDMSEAENDDETGLQDLVYEKYTITWTKGDTPPVNCNIYVSKTGYVLYNEDIEYLETDEDHFIESRSYRIDFNAFDSGIQAIIAEDANNVSPFGDFRTFDFMFCKGTDNYYNKSGEVYEKIADFLNKVDWGDKVTKVEQKIPQQVAEGITYEANWENGDRFCFFYIENDGHVHYGENITDIDTHVVTTVADCNYYIDFEAFDKGITEILAKYKAEAPTEAFEYAELLFGQHERLTPTDEEDMAKFEDFVRNDFIKMLEPTSSDDIVRGVTYSILTSYRLDDNKRRQANYFIFTDGFVECNEYKTDEKGEMQPTNTENYQIDMAKLESVLKDEIGVELPEYREININKVD